MENSKNKEPGVRTMVSVRHEKSLEKPSKSRVLQPQVVDGLVKSEFNLCGESQLSA